jgi:hypothetical protein
MNECVEIDKLYQSLINKELYHFPTHGKVNISNKHGVYIIYSPSNDVLHVGRTNRAKKGLNQRLQNHVNNGSSFSKKYLNYQGYHLREGYYFKFIEIDDGRKRALLEALAIGKLCPAHIGTGE